jgi:hypothetical protein
MLISGLSTVLALSGALSLSLSLLGSSGVHLRARQVVIFRAGLFERPSLSLRVPCIEHQSAWQNTHAVGVSLLSVAPAYGEHMPEVLSSVRVRRALSYAHGYAERSKCGGYSMPGAHSQAAR